MHPLDGTTQRMTRHRRSHGQRPSRSHWHHNNEISTAVLETDLDQHLPTERLRSAYEFDLRFT